MENFTIRLLEILKSKSLSASQFAEKIGVQRSSVSHVLSGRNKPSLDFIIKISTVFTDISLNWLIHGKKSNELISSNNIPSPTASNKNNILKSNSNEKQLKEIVFFYKDNSFKVYKN